MQCSRVTCCPGAGSVVQRAEDICSDPGLCSWKSPVHGFLSRSLIFHVVGFLPSHSGPSTCLCSEMATGGWFLLQRPWGQWPHTGVTQAEGVMCLVGPKMRSQISSASFWSTIFKRENPETGCRNKHVYHLGGCFVVPF